MPTTPGNPATVPPPKAEGYKGSFAASLFRVPQSGLVVPVPLELQCFGKLAPGMGNRSEFVQTLLSALPAKRDLLLYTQMSYGMDNLSALMNYLQAQADLCVQYGINYGSDSSVQTGLALYDQIESLVNRAYLLEVSQSISLPRVALVPITELTEEEKILFLLAAIGAEQETQKQIIQWQVAHLRSSESVPDVTAMLERLYTKHLLPLSNGYGLPQTGVHSFCEAMQNSGAPGLSKLPAPSVDLNLLELEIFAANIIFRCEDENKRKMVILANLDTLVSHCERSNYQDIDPRMEGFRNLFCCVLCLARQEQRQGIINRQSRRSAHALIQILPGVFNEKRLYYDVDITLGVLQSRVAVRSDGHKPVMASDVVPMIMKYYDGSRFRGKWKTFSGKDKTLVRTNKEDVLKEMLEHVEKCRPVANSNAFFRFFGTTAASTRRALIDVLPADQRDNMRKNFKQRAVGIEEYKSAFRVR